MVIGYNTTGNGSNSVTLGNTSVTKTYLQGDVSATGAITGSNLSGTNTGDQDLSGLEPALGDPTTDGYVLSSTIAGVRSWVVQSGGSGSVGGLYGINVATLTADKTLTSGTDYIYQNLDPSTASWTITLDTASAVAGDRFVIKNTDVATSYLYLIIKQGTTVLDYAYAQGTKAFVFDGTNWVGADNGVVDSNVAIGHNAQSFSSGVSIGYNANGYYSGATVGYNANGSSDGATVGYNANGSSSGAVVGYNANGYYSGVAIGYMSNGSRNGASIGYQAGKALTGYIGTNKNVLLGYQAGLLLTQPSAWVVSTAYTAGQYVRPSTANTYNYEVTTAGTSGTTEPTWSTTLGGTTTDGTVTWTTVSMRGNNNIILGYDLEETANTADTLNIGNTITGDLVTGDISIAGGLTLGTALTDANIASSATWNAKEAGLGNPTTDGYVLSSTALGVRSWIAPASGGTGTVTSVSVINANGVSGTVATATTTPAITLSLGTITPTTVNALTLASATTGFTIAGGTTSKTLTLDDNFVVSTQLSAISANTAKVGITTAQSSDITTNNAKVGVTTQISNVVEDTTPQLGGQLDAQANSIGFTLQTITYNATTTTVDWSLGNKATMTFGAGDIGTFAFTNPANPANFVLKLVQDTTGGRVVTAWDTDIKWANGTIPTLSTGAGAIDIIAFFWDGTNYFGTLSANFS